jgi:hypothetical protein
MCVSEGRYFEVIDTVYVDEKIYFGASNKGVFWRGKNILASKRRRRRKILCQNVDEEIYFQVTKTSAKKYLFNALKHQQTNIFPSHRNVSEEMSFQVIENSMKKDILKSPKRRKSNNISHCNVGNEIRSCAEK